MRNFATIIVYATLDNYGTNPMFDGNWAQAAKRHRRNMIENYRHALLRDMKGWEPPYDWPPPPPWTLEECPRCHLEVERGTVKFVLVYHQGDDQGWCKQRKSMCAACKDDLREIDEWPIRGDDGRFTSVPECAATPA